MELGAQELARVLGNMADAPQQAEKEVEVPQVMRPQMTAAATLSSQPKLPAVLENMPCDVGAWNAGDPLEPSEPGPPPQHRMLKAIEHGDDREAAELVRAADSITVNAVDESERNALMLAACEGKVEVARVLLARPDFHGVNVRNQVGCTALHLAAGNDNAEVLRELLNSLRFTEGVNAKNINGQAAMDFALDFGDRGACADLLAAAGANKADAVERTAQRRMSRMSIGSYTGMAEAARPPLATLVPSDTAPVSTTEGLLQELLEDGGPEPDMDELD